MQLEGLGCHLLNPLQIICTIEAQMLCKELESKKNRKGQVTLTGSNDCVSSCFVDFILSVMFTIIVQLSVSKLVSLSCSSYWIQKSLMLVDWTREAMKPFYKKNMLTKCEYWEKVRFCIPWWFLLWVPCRSHHWTLVRETVAWKRTM